jgi:D-lactate dehydrogenase
MMLSLNRKIHRAYNRVREGNFALDGLLGFDLHRKRWESSGLAELAQLLPKFCTDSGVACWDTMFSKT